MYCANSGAQRASTLDTVLELLTQAQAADETESWQAARSLFRQVQALDPATPGVNDNIQRLDRLIADREFRATMSDALAALNRGDLDMARTVFKRAKKMRPQAAAPADGLQEVARMEKQISLQFQRDQAIAMERAEDWTEAVKVYQSMLTQDPNLSFAKKGLLHAQDRADLQANLATYLADPTAWWSEKGRQEAQSLLQEARSVAMPGSKISAQTQLLAQQLVLARQQVTITLKSDTLCNVLVPRVARLGQFELHTLRLFPGRYTLVGTRDGYRDVRMQFLVRPGNANKPVTITCSDKV